MATLLKHLPGLITLAAALLVACCILPDYGISWDEDDQRKLGEINYNYLFKGDPALHTFINRDYGPAVEWPLIALEKNLGITDSRQAFLFRHGCIHFIFWIGLLFAYGLIFQLYRKSWLAALGIWLLLAMPHIYAHSFFNSKDISFLSFHLALFYFAYQLYAKGRWTDAVWLGIVSSMAVNLRLLGLITVGFVAFFLFSDLYRARWSKPAFRVQLRNLLLFALCFLVVLLGMWPYLWADPLRQFLTAYRNMAHFRWEFLVWFNGNMERSTALPWTYLPVWIAITTPLTTLMVGIGGMLYFRYRHWRGSESVFTDLLTRMNYLFLMVVACAFLSVWVLNPVLLDGWRHFYYIFPPFVLLGIYGIAALNGSRFQKVVVAALGAGTISTLVFMVMHHPFQYVYFNILANQGHPEQVRRKFEMDYWGISYKKGLEYILEADPSDTIRVAFENYPGKSNIQILPAKDRSRLLVTEKAEANYFLTNYRNHPEDYAEYQGQQWRHIMVDHNTILSVFKLK